MKRILGALTLAVLGLGGIHCASADPIGVERFTVVVKSIRLPQANTTTSICDGTPVSAGAALTFSRTSPVKIQSSRGFRASMHFTSADGSFEQLHRRASVRHQPGSFFYAHTHGNSLIQDNSEVTSSAVLKLSKGKLKRRALIKIKHYTVSEDGTYIKCSGIQYGRGIVQY